MAVKDAKIATPEDAQACLVWRFVEKTFLQKLNEREILNRKGDHGTLKYKFKFLKGNVSSAGPGFIAVFLSSSTLLTSITWHGHV